MKTLTFEQKIDLICKYLECEVNEQKNILETPLLTGVARIRALAPEVKLLKIAPQAKTSFMKKIGSIFSKGGAGQSTEKAVKKAPLGKLIDPIEYAKRKAAIKATVR